MEKIINLLINNWTKGVDTYTHNGSTWLIFSESKQWVIELTESKTLWYNYNFFKELFSLTSMDVVDNQHYITKWVEDNLINKVKDTILEKNITEGEVEGIIEMAVKENSFSFVRMKVDCENVIENGVKEIQVNVTKNKMSNFVSDSLIQNGVKENSLTYVGKQIGCEDALENGVRHTEKSLQIDGSCVIEDTIQNGVKKTTPSGYLGSIEMNGKIVHQIESPKQNNEVEDTIQNGVKHTEIGWHQCNNVDDVIEKGVIETKVIKNGIKKSIAAGYEKPNSLVYLKSPDEIDEVLENGVRHTLNTEYMPTSMVEDIIQSGVKEIKGHGFEQQNIIDDIVENGVKETLVSGSWNNDKMEDVLQNGVKETFNFDEKHALSYEQGVKKLVEDVIQNGVKETKTPGKDGDILSTIEWMKENNSTSYTKMIDDVIENGVKETLNTEYMPQAMVEDTIQNGTKNPSV
jgi:hypothetical protein